MHHTSWNLRISNLSVLLVQDIFQARPSLSISVDMLRIKRLSGSILSLSFFSADCQDVILRRATFNVTQLCPSNLSKRMFEMCWKHFGAV